ncbi:hypothetical protein C8F04DRAFT_1197414 [Mycena alexandri]|uniref:Uncharacterized protein n=1 Tax=Mycena alexandri TaxID=1745969 RepID=A0AAD6S200_9AGAR|nr:hypothetical protein C8F04DRAFT_1197414 [Mycena alexandri]
MQLRPRPLRPPSSQLRVLGPLEVQRQASNKRRMLRKRRERKLEQISHSTKCSPNCSSFFLPPYTSSNVSTLNDFPLAGDPFYDFSPAFMPSESSALMVEPSAPPSTAFFMSAQQVAESSTALMEEPFSPPSTSFFMPAQYSAKPGALLIAEPFSPPSTTFLTPAQRLESNQQHPNEWLDSARDSSVIGRQRAAPDEKEVFLVKKKKMLNGHIHSVQRPNAEIYSTNEAYDSLFQHHPPTLQTQSIHVGIAYYRREAIFRADGILGPIVDGQILSCKGYLDGNWEVVFRLITTQAGRDLLCLHNYLTKKAAILSVHNRDYWGKVDNADELMVTQIVF